MNENSSRVEKLLQNILGSDFNLEAPRSRMEQILKDIIDEVDPVSINPKSRIENLLIGVASLISHGDTATFVPLEVTENGRYDPGEEGYDGFGVVEVNVPQTAANLDSLVVTENGTYTPGEEGYDGFGVVEVNVPQTAANFQSLTVTENGIYEPEEGYDGFSSVEVDVPSEGYTNYTTRTGSLADVLSNIDMPFINIVFYLRTMLDRINVFPWAIIDASQIGLGKGGGPIMAVTENDQTVLKLLIGQVDQSSSLATAITWDSTGLISAYVEQNGTITNLLSVASQINITIYLPTAS